MTKRMEWEKQMDNDLVNLMHKNGVKAPNCAEREQMTNPFKKSVDSKRYVKLLIYGAAGVGKTTIALQFPKPCVIDLESGSNLYGEKYGFDVFAPSSTKELSQAVQFLLRDGEKHYETLVIDPITVAWETLQFEWQEIFMQRNKGTVGDKQDFYTLQPGDWVQLKSRWKDLMRDLIALPLHVVCIAREKALYADGAFMKKIGTTFDSEKSLDYWFDSVVQLVWNGKKREALTIKDRSEKLPPVGQKFDLTFAPFAKLLGKTSPADNKKTPTALDTQKIESANTQEHDGARTEKKNEAVADFEQKLYENLDWMRKEKPPGQQSTWEELGQNFDAKTKNGFMPGRDFLKNLISLEKASDDIKAKAKITLAECVEKLQEAAKSESV